MISSFARLSPAAETGTARMSIIPDEQPQPADGMTS
jgi:hypothetical protein